MKARQHFAATNDGDFHAQSQAIPVAHAAGQPRGAKAQG
jgi:hypothetical protein